MVILGGLEIIAAGYVLNELGKDEDKAKEVARRRRHHHHHHHKDDIDHRPRPQRPSQHTLAPPMMGPPRPNSAPPVQPYQQHPPRPGPWQNQPQQQIQHQPSFPNQRPPNSQTWPQGPSNGPMFRPQDFPANPNHQPPRPPPQHQSPPPPYTQHSVPPGPGHLQSRPTMHYDMKTGKWQSDMLPPEMPRSNSMPVESIQGQSRSASTQPPPSGLRQSRRANSHKSYSSSESESDTEDDDLAYGSLPGRKQRHDGSFSRLAPPPPKGILRAPSHERERPPQQYQQQHSQQPPQPQAQHGQSRAEHDWYADQRNGRRPNGHTAPVEMEQQMRYELP